MDGRITSLPAPASLSADVMTELQHLYEVLGTEAAADRLWDRVLTSDEKTRLGRNVTGSAAALWKRLHGCSWARAVIEASWKLDLVTTATRERLLRRTGEAVGGEEALRRAVSEAVLVLTDSPPTAYLRGRAIPIAWDRYPSLWKYLWTLCTAAKAGAHVTARDFSQTKKSDDHVKAKSRLSGTRGFPRELTKAIKAERGGKQRLTIDREQIRIFQSVSHDELVEVV